MKAKEGRFEMKCSLEFKEALDIIQELAIGINSRSAAAEFAAKTTANRLMEDRVREEERALDFEIKKRQATIDSDRGRRF